MVNKTPDKASSSFGILKDAVIEKSVQSKAFGKGVASYGNMFVALSELNDLGVIKKAQTNFYNGY